MMVPLLKNSKLQTLSLNKKMTPGGYSFFNFFQNLMEVHIVAILHFANRKFEKGTRKLIVKAAIFQEGFLGLKVFF